MKQGPGDLVVGEANRLLQVDGLGEEMDRVCRRHDEFGVAAAALGEIPGAQENLLTDGDAAYLGADGAYVARDIIAGVNRERRHPLVDAAADQNVRLADPKRLGPDLNVPGSRIRSRQIHLFERVGATYLADKDGFHLSGHAIP